MTHEVERQKSTTKQRSVLASGISFESLFYCGEERYMTERASQVINISKTNKDWIVSLKTNDRMTLNDVMDRIRKNFVPKTTEMIIA